MQALYIEAMDELLAKDLSFFHDNFAGSLTKRTLGYARRFEDIFDVLCFSVSSNVIPLVVRRRGAVVVLAAADRRPDWDAGGDVRAGLPADPPAAAAGRCPRGRVERAVGARGRLDRQRRGGARLRARARRGADPRPQRAATSASKTLRSWDYQNLRIDTITAPMNVLTNALGLAVALATSADHRRQPGGGIHHLQLLHVGHARDVGVQPHLPEHRERHDRRGAVHRAAARSAGGGRRRRSRSAFAPRDFGVELRT